MDKLELFKRENDLVAFARSLGYEVGQRTSSRNSSALRDARDNIVISRDPSDGHFTCFTVGGAGDRGSVIDFEQARRCGNLGHVRIRLRDWLGLSGPVALNPRPRAAPPTPAAVVVDRTTLRS